MLVARLYSILYKVLPRVSSTSNILFHPPTPAQSEQRHWVWVVHSVHLCGTQPYFIFATSMQEAINLRADLHHSLPPIHTLLPAPSGSYMGPHLFLLPAEKGRDGHYALLQSRASDVGPACLLNTLQCPARMNRDDEISWISEQEWATSICLAVPLYAQQFPRWLFKLHRDSPWIIHYLPSISVHSNRQQISSCHTQGNKSIWHPKIKEIKRYTALKISQASWCSIVFCMLLNNKNRRQNTYSLLFQILPTLGVVFNFPYIP